MRFASNGQEGLAAIAEQKPDLVLLDVLMPIMNGFDCLKALRSDPKMQNLPVIMLTVNDDAESIQQAFDNGATDFIPKPIHWPMLVHRLNYVVRNNANYKRLQLSESQLLLAASVFSNTSEGILITDEYGVILSVNPAFSEITGYAADEAIGKKPSLLQSQRHDEAFYISFWKALVSMGFWQGEIWNRRKNGEHYLEWLTINRVQEGIGKGLNYIAIFSDITETRRKEEALVSSEQKFRTLAENLPDSIARYDQQCRVIYINRQLERVLGMSAEELLGKTPREFKPIGCYDKYQAKIKEVIQTGQDSEIELDIPGNGDGLRYHHIRLVAEYGLDGEITGAIAIGRDYTEQKRLEYELICREREFRTLAENSPDIIARFDRDCRRIYVNPAYKMEVVIPLEMPQNSAQAEVWEPLISNKEYLALLKQVIESGTSDHILLEWSKPDGSQVSFDTRVLAEYDEKGLIVGALSIGHNITELKETEHYLEESRAQLRALAAKLEKDREEERKRISREIHDELGQLLSVLRLNINTLDFRFGDENLVLRDQAQKMVNIIDRAIHVVRSLATRLRPAVLNSGIVSALEWLLNEYADNTGIICELHKYSDNIPLDNDRGVGVFHICQEALTNVLRHSGADRVDITLRNEAGIFKLDVRDNGKGFDPINTNRPSSLGIIGMMERARILKGTLDIVPAKEGGTVLKLRIPIKEQHEPDMGGRAGITNNGVQLANNKKPL